MAPDGGSLQSKDQVGPPLESSLPHTFLCGSVAGCRPAEQGHHKTREVRTAWLPSTFPALKHKDEAELLGLKVPLVAHNSGMHVIWQPHSRALTSPPVAGIWTCGQMVASGCRSAHLCVGSLHHLLQLKQASSSLCTLVLPWSLQADTRH